MSNERIEEIKQLIDETKKIHEMHKRTLETLKEEGINGFTSKQTKYDAKRDGVSTDYLFYQEIKRLRTEIESYFLSMSELLNLLKEAEMQQD